MKIVEFPDKKKDDRNDILDFFENAKVMSEEHGTTDAVIVMINDEGEIGVSVHASIMDAMALLAIAQQKLLG